jgi:hypothetical protein
VFKGKPSAGEAQGVRGFPACLGTPCLAKKKIKSDENTSGGPIFVFSAASEDRRGSDKARNLVKTELRPEFYGNPR